MLIVETDAARVEVALRSGWLTCPHCAGALRPWGRARERTLRRRGEALRHQPRRARCSSCMKTSVLLPDVALVRRVDEVAVIGAALLRHAAGAGQRRIAAALGRPRETVRSWIQRFAERAGALVAHFRAWSFALDARLDDVAVTSSSLAEALEAIGSATRAASLLLGPRPPWCWASALSGGRLLANTSPPFPLPR